MLPSILMHQISLSACRPRKNKPGRNRRSLTEWRSAWTNSWLGSPKHFLGGEASTGVSAKFIWSNTGGDPFGDSMFPTTANKRKIEEVEEAEDKSLFKLRPRGQRGKCPQGKLKRLTSRSLTPCPQ